MSQKHIKIIKITDNRQIFHFQIKWDFYFKFKKLNNNFKLDLHPSRGDDLTMFPIYFSSIDATAESGKLGRLVNHSRNGNLMTKTVLVNDLPHLVLLAKEDIPEGVEVTYDYGDRSKEALQHHPWLAF